MGAIYLVRHGQASFGSDDYDRLSELGIEQAAVAGRDLAARGIEPEAVVHGSLRRQRDTATLLREAAGWTCPLEVDDRLDEYDALDVLGYADPAEVEAVNNGTSTRSFQKVLDAGLRRWWDSETCREAADRMNAAVAEHAERTSGGRSVVLVSSAGAIAFPVASLLSGVGLEGPGKPDRDVWIALQRVAVNTAGTRIVSGRGGHSLITYNEHQHLELSDAENPRRMVTFR